MFDIRLDIIILSYSYPNIIKGGGNSLGSPKVGMGPNLTIKLDGEELDNRYITKFEWKAFINNGYIIRVSLVDPYWNILRSITNRYLQKGRNAEIKLEWQMGWSGQEPMSQKMALITHLPAAGTHAGTGSEGGLYFYAIDPPSYYLNIGNSDGSVFEGNVSQVIEKVIRKYAPKIGTVEVSKTRDYNKNKWWMMRMDPMAFIESLCNWSSSITNNKTNWIVVCDQDSILVKEQAELKSRDLGTYSVNANSPGGNDARHFEVLFDNYLTQYQTKVLTQGISAVSEKYLDKKTDKNEEFVVVKDENTSNKKNTNTKQDRAFKKPVGNLNTDSGPSIYGGTNVKSIPEFAAGDLGLRYGDFIDGTARKTFLDALRRVSRIRIRVNGDVQLSDSKDLGVSKITLDFKDADGQNFFLSGPWMIYGWHHTVITGSSSREKSDWYTDVYLMRIDYDASAEKV